MLFARIISAGRPFSLGVVPEWHRLLAVWVELECWLMLQVLGGMYCQLATRLSLELDISGAICGGAMLIGH